MTLLKEPYYNQARVFVAPTRIAAGIPHKIHEASAYGLPVVATQLLADQLGWTHGDDLLSSDASDPEAFIRHCVSLYTDERLWMKLRENALARIEEECSPKHFARVIRDNLSQKPGNQMGKRRPCCYSKRHTSRDLTCRTC